MKKSLIVLLSMVFVLSTFAIVLADDGGVDSVRAGIEGSKVVIGGDARVRGIWEHNWDMDAREATADDHKRYWDQRVRLKITAQLPEGVELRTRLTTNNDTWDGAANTGGMTNDADLDVDFAYLHVPVGTATIDLGRQKSDWGNKLLEWNATRDRAKLIASFGSTRVGAYTDKIDDTNNASGNKNSNDVDDYGIFVIHKADVVEGGALAVIYDDNTTAKNNGVRGSAYVKVNVARVAIKAELAIKNGDVYETTDKDSNTNETQFGVFASVAGGPEKVTITGLVALTQDGYVADSHFTPTVLIGTDNPTAMANFGSNPDSATGGAQDSFLAVVGVDAKVVQDVSIYGKAALLVMDAYANNFASTKSSAGAIELDAGLKYQIAKNTTYKVDFGYMFPSDITVQDDEAMALAHSISINF